MHKRYKILVNCYACSPYKGSEPGMGWNFVKCLSPYHELHILTEGKFQKDIEKYFTEHPEERKLFHFYFIKKNRHKKLRKIWPPSYYWFYKQWQKQALKFALELDAEYNFDIVHQLNMVGYREPGYLYKLNKPLVWGPIGGMCISPWKLLPSMGLYGFLYYFSRNIVNLWQMYFKLRVRTFANKSHTIIAATKDNQDGIMKVWKKKSIIIPEVGFVDTCEKIYPSYRNGILKICWSGQHTPGKALNLLIKALNLLDYKNDIELHVIGEGKYTKRWKKMADKFHLHNIKWYGWVQREQAIDIMRQCHVLCITSQTDLTSTVLLEALSLGLPVIALDHCGFSNVITENCGIKIPIHSQKQVIADFAKAIDCLAENENYRQQLAAGAFERAKDFTWEKKAEKINLLYNSILTNDLL
jgi:glycosyltransferase involved in cell wall biosynthesis